jgi:hypothetical protein
MCPDVATGSVVGIGEAAFIEAQKATIPEQHICSEGYGVSSRIVHEMSRAVDVAEVMRFWGTASRMRVELWKSHRIATRKGRSLAEKAMLAIINDFIFRAWWRRRRACRRTIMFCNFREEALQRMMKRRLSQIGGLNSHQESN